MSKTTKDASEVEFTVAGVVAGGEEYFQFAAQGNWTDAATLSITVGDTSQELFAANTARRGLIVQNHGPDDLWINFNAAATKASPSIRIPPGASYEPEIVDPRAINIIGATTAQAFTAKQV